MIHLSHKDTVPNACVMWTNDCLTISCVCVRGWNVQIAEQLINYLRIIPTVPVPVPVCVRVCVCIDGLSRINATICSGTSIISWSPIEKRSHYYWHCKWWSLFLQRLQNWPGSQIIQISESKQGPLDKQALVEGNSIISFCYHYYDTIWYNDPW